MAILEPRDLFDEVATMVAYNLTNNHQLHGGETQAIDFDFDMDDEDSLKTKALHLWDQRDRGEDQRKRSESSIAPVLYVLCKKLNAQGKKGNGFRAWLHANKKSKTTAYRWISEYCKASQKELPWPQKEHSKPTSETSSHVGQALPIECSHEPALSPNPVPSIPAVKVEQLSEDAQISMLGIGTLAEVLKDAKELVQTPGEQFRRSMDLFDPSTQEYVLFDSPEYNWSPQVQSGELAKAQAYVVALKTTLKALTRGARQVRSQLKALETYIKRLNDNDQPLYQVVPKRVPLSVKEIQKEAA
jgi:hypothetical protein